MVISIDNKHTLGIVIREEGLEGGGVAKLCYCSMSRDCTGAL